MSDSDEKKLKEQIKKLKEIIEFLEEFEIPYELKDVILLSKPEEKFRGTRRLIGDDEAKLREERQRKRRLAEMDKRTWTNRRTGTGGKRWTRKYKKSINCKNPKGFSQKQYCKYGRKTR